MGEAGFASDSIAVKPAFVLVPQKGLPPALSHTGRPDEEPKNGPTGSELLNTSPSISLAFDYSLLLHHTGPKMLDFRLRETEAFASVMRKFW